jgi:hypothetical protein
MTLEELKNAERDAYNHYMYHEAAERGYDFQAAKAAEAEYIAAKTARENREKADALIETSPDDSILGLARQIKQLSEKL